MADAKPEMPATTIITDKCRGSYMHIAQPKKNDKGVEKFSCMVLLPKTDRPTQLAIKAAIDAAVLVGVEKKMWSSPNTLPDGFKKPIRDGDKELATGQKKEKYRDVYEGMLFFNASANVDRPPFVCDRHKKEILNLAKEVYSGAFYRFEINFYPYVNTGAYGIAAGLQAIQKISEGTPLGGGGSTGENFSDYPDDEANEGSEEVTF